MNADHTFFRGGVNKLRVAPHLRDDFNGRARVVVLGSFMGGYHVVNELVLGELSNQIEIVGIATDDPSKPYTNAKVRLWRHPHSADDETLVKRFAAALEIPVSTGNVKSGEFEELMAHDWKPDLCLMATFGQKIPKHIIDLPRLGFFNFHHSGPTWPSYPGPDPIGDMQREGLSSLVLTLHRVTEVIDGGEFFARSHPVKIPVGINAIEMHRITWPQMGGFIRNAVKKIIGADAPKLSGFDSMSLHEDAPPYMVNVVAHKSAPARATSADNCMARLRL